MHTFSYAFAATVAMLGLTRGDPRGVGGVATATTTAGGGGGPEWTDCDWRWSEWSHCSAPSVRKGGEARKGRGVTETEQRR